MFGSVSEWFYKTLAGIQPAPDAVGFDKIIIKPQPVGDLQWVKARYQSVRGNVVSEWERTSEQFRLRLAIPVGATATVFVPARDSAGVREGGRPAGEADGVKFLRHEAGAAVFALGAGRYEFTSQ